MNIAAEIVHGLRRVVGDDEFVGLHIPDITDLEKRRVMECLDSTYVSSVGRFVGEFEDAVAEYTGAGHGIAVSNGTSALQVALQLAGVRRGDDVLVPALSFIATANAVMHAGGQPYFLDSDEDTLGLSVEAVASVLRSARTGSEGLINPVTGNRIGAIVPMHTLGHPMRIGELVALADEYGVPVVEDAAESLGSRVGEKHTGTFGRVGILSFNGNKILTTGGGGMILTDDDELARRAKHLTTTAKRPHRWEFEHDEVAFNYRMPNLNAALGVAQLERLPAFVDAKRRLAAQYSAVFAALDGVTFLEEPPGTSSNYWLCAIRLGDGAGTRDEVLEATNAAGLQCRPFWNLLPSQAPYRDLPHGGFPVAEALHTSVVCIPSSPALADA
ncbi:LegC family aminotransferase [Microbacterium sp. NPDC077486]|uniref:LegC family aminotransferase n=1 Tax=Microbacterium sp. NPDC077486 TaxID=3154766 RepID=UPI003435D336